MPFKIFVFQTFFSEPFFSEPFFPPPPQKIIKIGMPARPPLHQTPPALRRPNFGDFWRGGVKKMIEKNGFTQKKSSEKNGSRKNGTEKNGSEKKVFKKKGF